MARDTSNGAYWALGLAGLAAGVAALKGRRSTSMGTGRGGSFARLPDGSSCACCGTRVGSFAKSEAAPKELESGFLKTRFDTGLRYRRETVGRRSVVVVYEVTGKDTITPLYNTGKIDVSTLVADDKGWAIKPAHGSSLLRARYDSRSAFIVPYEDPKKLKALFNKESKIWSAEFNAMGKADKASAQKRLADLLFKQHGIGSYDDKGNLEAPTDAEEYAKTKAGMLTRAGYDVKEKDYKPNARSRYEKAYLDLYLGRKWTIYLMGKYKEHGASTPGERFAVFSGERSTGKDVFDQISLDMFVPKPVPSSVFAVVPARQQRVSVGVTDAMNEAAQSEQEGELDKLVGAEGSVEGGPELRMFRDGERVSIFFIAQAGSQCFPYGTSRIPLLTQTSKMASPSFGLPAGQTGSEGGTCLARVVAQRFFVKSGEDKPGRREVVCDRCYATGANYGYANNMLAQQGRVKWVQQLKKQGEDVLAYQLAVMIASYALHVGGKERSEQELGTWSKAKGQIQYTTPTGQRRDVEPTSLRLVLSRSLLRDEQVVRLKRGTKIEQICSTDKWFEAMGVGDGQVCGFFRLHDSGDFGLGHDYWNAWGKVCEMLPGVQFWAPTRMWAKMEKTSVVRADAHRARFHDGLMREFEPTSRGVQKTYKLRKQAGSRGFASTVKHQQPEADPISVSPGEAGNQLWEIDKSLDVSVTYSDSTLHFGSKRGEERGLVALSEEHANLALRPSTLYVTQAMLSPDGKAVSTGESSNIPYIDGLSAGTGVVKKLRGVYPAVYDMRGFEAYPCPVYTATFKTVNKKTGEPVTREAVSCQEASCRACWLAQNLPVFYGAH